MKTLIKLSIILIIFLLVAGFSFPYKEFSVKYTSYTQSVKRTDKGEICFKKGKLLAHSYNPNNYALYDGNDRKMYVYERKKHRLYVYPNTYDFLSPAIYADTNFFKIKNTPYGYMGIAKHPKKILVDSIKSYVNKEGMIDSMEVFRIVRLAFITGKDYSIYRFEKWDSICPTIAFPEEPKETINVQDALNKTFGGGN